MPNPKEITLHASATRTTAGSSAAVDVEARTFTEVTFDVTAITGTLVLLIESSPSQSSWVALGHFHTVSTVGLRTLIVPDGHRYLRASWTLGASSSATFVVTGIAHQLYATPKDVSATGASVAKVVASIPLVEVAQSCLAASSEAEGYLASANTLPIATVDAATRQHVARMAVFELFRFRPSSIVGAATGGNSSVIEIGRSEALGWLKGISTGRVRPPGLVDATPDTAEESTDPGELYVVSGPSRGW